MHKFFLSTVHKYTIKRRNERISDSTFCKQASENFTPVSPIFKVFCVLYFHDPGMGWKQIKNERQDDDGDEKRTK